VLILSKGIGAMLKIPWLLSSLCEMGSWKVLWFLMSSITAWMGDRGSPYAVSGALSFLACSGGGRISVNEGSGMLGKGPDGFLAWIGGSRTSFDETGSLCTGSGSIL